MKNICCYLLCLFFLGSCSIRPRNFSYYFSNQNTGLDQLIRMDGYYVSQFACDSSFYSMYMFYPNGLFTIATTNQLLPELVRCFENGGTSGICRYPLWGIYRIEGNRIKTQVIRTEGSSCTIFRDYLILPDKTIINVSDYVEPQHTHLGYMADYPSYTENPCEKKAEFFPLKTKRNYTECPYLNKKWFSEKK